MPPVSSRMITTSTPLITSALSGDAAISSFTVLTGRIFANSAEQNRVAVVRGLEHLVGQRSAGGVHRVTANHALLELEIDRRSARDDLENLQGFADDLGADAVTFEN